MEDDVKCVLAADKESYKDILTDKKNFLSEELKREKDFYDKTGLYSGRNESDIQKDIDKLDKVLKSIDNLPVCE